jgi:hypothetical protein
MPLDGGGAGRVDGGVGAGSTFFNRPHHVKVKRSCRGSGAGGGGAGVATAGVRREIGKEQREQVPYGEGVTIHVDTEPCADVRKGAGEASAGARTAQPLNRERPIIPGADTVPNVEGHMHGRADRERPDDPAWS